MRFISDFVDFNDFFIYYDKKWIKYSSNIRNEIAQVLCLSYLKGLFSRVINQVEEHCLYITDFRLEEHYLYGGLLRSASTFWHK